MANLLNGSLKCLTFKKYSKFATNSDESVLSFGQINVSRYDLKAQFLNNEILQVLSKNL